eukprot:363678-Chlamydomonas_euryale.AAC.6
MGMSTYAIPYQHVPYSINMCHTLSTCVSLPPPVTNVTIPGLAAYYALLVLQILGYRGAHSASPKRLRAPLL